MRGVESIENRKVQVGICLLIFLCFLYTGSAYISWFYLLGSLFDSSSADWFSEGIGYLCQAAGILVFALIARRAPKLAESSSLMLCVMVADGLATTCALLFHTQAGVLGFGLLMNLLHGAIAGIYLSKLARFIPQQKRGAVFGIAYGLGSIVTWMISLLADGRFLRSASCLVAYAIMIALILLVNHKVKGDEPPIPTDDLPGFDRAPLVLMATVVILLSVVKGLGFYFPASESLSGTISLEFTRAFYAIGLVVAGFICDKNRKYGAVCCVAALVFPFVGFALTGEPGASQVLWILGYIFFGFFSVYRVVLFSDIAGKDGSLLWMAGFGLMFGRVGDAAGVVGGILMGPHDIVLVAVSAILFVVTVLAFFALYHRLYVPVLAQGQNEEGLLSEFETRFELSPRECDVFRLMMKGQSNGEIAGALYISESTVKFHVKNILRKTDCTNRSELAVKYKRI